MKEQPKWRDLREQTQAEPARPIHYTERMFDLAVELTDEVMGWGAYAKQNADSPNPEVQAAIERWRDSHVLSSPVEKPVPGAGDDELTQLRWLVQCSCGGVARAGAPDEATYQGEMHRAGALGP